MTGVLAARSCSILAAALVWQADGPKLDGPEVENYARRLSMQPAEPAEGAQPRPAPPARRVPAPDEVPVPPTLEQLQGQVPDPEDARTSLPELVAPPENEAQRAYARRVLARLDAIRRPKQLTLSLEDAVRRALASNYGIRVEGYNPAINTTRIVEAEAAFDATFFLNTTKNIQDQPSPSQLQGTNIDTFNMQGGIRKLLPIGMQVSTSLEWTRQTSNTQFALLNPSHFSQFVTEFRQPLLRGFGLDFNRSQIVLARNDRTISLQTFEQRVRDTLDQTEQAYWRLVQARREVVISARLLASFEQIYDYLYQRRDFDAFRIQLAETKARLESNKANFIRIVQNVLSSEDRLIALMNDPAINLSTGAEIRPTDFPANEPLDIDPIGEAQTALEHRSEIREAKLRIENARVLVGVAKNQALPRLDLTFRYVVDGLGESADDSFDEVTKNDFHEYFIGLEFEIPIGNRARRAAWRRAVLQWAQSTAALKQVLEGVILETNVAARDLISTHRQIEPNYQSTVANEDQVQSIISRAERRDFPQLSQELGAYQGLAASRSDLLRSMVDYSIAIVNLERAKGTLLQYNNVVLPEEE